MVTPNQKRVAVLALVDEFGVSQRRACLVAVQYRSMQLHCLVRSSEEKGLRERIRALAVKYPRDGYRRIHVMLLCAGYLVNRKRVQRPEHRKPKIARMPVCCSGSISEPCVNYSSSMDS